MKKSIIILFCMLFIVSSITGQKTNDGGNTESNDNNNDESCQNSCMNTLVDIACSIVGEYHKNLLNSNDPYVTSLETMLHGGAGIRNDETYYTALPRVKLNYGALSGDFRYSYSTFETGSSSFLDALIEFNIIAGKSFKMSLGQGIMYLLEKTENNIYHESFIGLDLGILNRMILISPEFRLAYDWNISKPVNSELSLRGGYQIFGNSSFAIYANLAAAYQYMGSETINTLIYGGFDIFIW